jgi:hypothetical protein
MDEDENKAADAAAGDAGKAQEKQDDKAPEKKDEGGADNADDKDVPENFKKYANRLKSQLETSKSELKHLKDELNAKKQAEDEAKAESLKKQGEFEKLYNSEKQKAESAKKRLVMSELRIKAAEEGIVDVDLVSMIDASKAKVSDDYEVSGIDVLVKEFKAAKPHLFGETKAQKAEQEKAKPKDTGTKVADPKGKTEKKAASDFFKNPDSKDAKDFLNGWSSSS